MLVGALLAFILGLMVIWGGVLSYGVLSVLFFSIGLAISSQVIAYPVVAESNSLSLTGTAESIASVLIMSGGFTLSLFAFVMNYHSAAPMKSGTVPVYSVAQYHWALSLLLVAFLVAAGLVFALRETNCKAMGDGD